MPTVRVTETKPCGEKVYYASYQMDECRPDCPNLRRVVWVYHPDDLRDPEATISIHDKEGRTVYWLYPRPRAGADRPILNPDGTIAGYGLNCPSITVKTK